MSSKAKGKEIVEGNGARKSNFLLVAAAGLFVFAIQNATGQEAQGGQGREVQVLEEIIVTATKRAERIQDVPMSIAVIGSQDIERRGLIGMEDYLRAIPGVSQIDRGADDNAIIIRGITTSLQLENFNAGPTVATYFGETPITGAAGLASGTIDVRPVDIERIELLRGPQGTTYGSSSLGGALRVIPAKPDLGSFGGKLAASYSETSGNGSDNSMIHGVINFPVIADKFGLRAVGYRYDESGFYRNVAGIDPATIANFENWGAGDVVSGYVEDGAGRMRTTGGRLAALWKLTEKLDISLNFLTQKIEQDGLPLANTGRYEQTRAPVPAAARLRGRLGDVADTKINLANLELNYDLGWGALTSVISSVDGGYAKAIDFSNGTGLPWADSHPDNGFDSISAEMRVASTLDGRFQFLVGLFYEDIENDFVESTHWTGAPGLNVFGTTPVSLSTQNRQLDQRAAFGEVSLDVTDKLTATVGGRYFEYTRHDRGLFEGGLIRVPHGTGVPTDLKTDANGSTFSASLSYKPTQTALLYASWSEGFRLGRPSQGAVPTLCDFNPIDGVIDGTPTTLESTKTIDSDYIESYEIGGKFNLSDRLTVDTSLYHLKWDGLPFRFTTATCPAFIANVGAATSSGAELQASLLVIDGLRLDLGFGYTKAELSRDAPGLPGAPKDGARLPGSPEINANLSVQYDFSVGGYNTFARADSAYVGELYGDFLETPGVKAGDYIKIDARVGIEVKKMSVELFLQNLTNEDAFTYRGTAVGAAFFGYRLQPRTAGIQLTYSFE